MARFSITRCLMRIFSRLDSEAVVGQIRAFGQSKRDKRKGEAAAARRIRQQAGTRACDTIWV